MYAKCFKRLIDFILSLIALIVLSPILLILTVTGAIAMKGNPFFLQPRPGKKDKYGKERIFRLIKYRTMSNARDKYGNLLPDDQRLGKYGKILRSTSLDELPELLNILKGDMSIIGPRPQLVRDMVFMTDEQRMRHTAKPGMSGLAQVRGRNAITWEEKLDWDLKYIEKVSFSTDAKIVLETVKVAFIHQEGITDGENATSLDYGDALLKYGKITKEEYDQKQIEAKRIIANQKYRK